MAVFLSSLSISHSLWSHISMENLVGPTIVFLLNEGILFLLFSFRSFDFQNL